MTNSVVRTAMCYLLLAGGLFYSGCNTESPETRESIQKIDSLNTVISGIKKQVDSLKRATAHVDTVDDFNWYHPDYEGRALQKQGIDQPENFIISALKNRPELIPLDPVMGGSMRFTRVEVLSRQWIIAAYEDGHIMGRTLYRYNVDSDRNITFEIIDSTRM